MKGILAVVILAIVLLLIASMWKIYVKAGKPGWAAIIPIYNLIVLLQIIQKPLWWIILLIIPYVNIVGGILVDYHLAKSFGKGEGFAIGLILLPIIFLPILAFGDAEYQYGQGTEA